MSNRKQADMSPGLPESGSTTDQLTGWFDTHPDANNVRIQTGQGMFDVTKPNNGVSTVTQSKIQKGQPKQVNLAAFAADVGHWTIVAFKKGAFWVLRKKAYVAPYKGGYGCFSHDGKLLGKHSTKEEAEDQLKAVEVNKHGSKTASENASNPESTDEDTDEDKNVVAYTRDKPMPKTAIKCLMRDNALVESGSDVQATMQDLAVGDTVWGFDEDGIQSGVVQSIEPGAGKWMNVSIKGNDGELYQTPSVHLYKTNPAKQAKKTANFPPSDDDTSDDVIGDTSDSDDPFDGIMKGLDKLEDHVDESGAKVLDKIEDGLDDLFGSDDSDDDGTEKDAVYLPGVHAEDHPDRPVNKRKKPVKKDEDEEMELTDADLEQVASRKKQAVGPQLPPDWQERLKTQFSKVMATDFAEGYGGEDDIDDYIVRPALNQSMFDGNYDEIHTYLEKLFASSKQASVKQASRKKAAGGGDHLQTQILDELTGMGSPCSIQELMGLVEGVNPEASPDEIKQALGDLINAGAVKEDIGKFGGEKLYRAAAKKQADTIRIEVFPDQADACDMAAGPEDADLDDGLDGLDDDMFEDPNAPSAGDLALVDQGMGGGAMPQDDQNG